MELNEKTLSSQLVYDGQLLKVYYDTVELVDGNTSWREVIRHPGAVVVVPIAKAMSIWSANFAIPMDGCFWRYLQASWSQGRILFPQPSGN